MRSGVPWGTVNDRPSADFKESAMTEPTYRVTEIVGS
jgi:hypothetical protein